MLELRKVLEKAEIHTMMILLPILVGLYLITMIGYYKTLFRTRELGDAKGSPLVLKGTVGVLALIWPVIIVYGLVVEALKLD